MTAWDRSRELQRVIEAMQMPLARTDHPVAQSATADRNPGPLEGLRQAIERRAVDIFVNEREGQRRGRGDAAGQGLRGHRRDDDGRADPGAVAVSAGIFEPRILQNLRLHLDLQLLGHQLAHAMHRVAAARTDLLVVGKVILDALARQVLRQGPAPAFLAVRLLGVRQSRVRQINGIRFVAALVCICLAATLLGFVEDAIHVLFAARRKTMQPRERQFFLKLEDALREDVPLSLQRGDFGRMRRQKRHQLRNGRGAGSIHRIVESEASPSVNRQPHPTNS